MWEMSTLSGQRKYSSIDIEPLSNDNSEGDNSNADSNLMNTENTDNVNRIEENRDTD